MIELSSAKIAKVRSLLSGLSAASAVAASGRAQAAARPESERHALAELMFLVAAVDGDVSDDELAQFSSSVANLFDDGDAEVGAARLVGFAERLAADGWDRRLAAVAATLRETRAVELAYRLAAAIAFVDDVVANAEAAALDAIAAALGLDADRANGLMRAVHAELFR